MEELKYCPLCGGSARIRRVHTYRGRRSAGYFYRPECVNDACLLNDTTACYATEEEARAEWNRRVETESSKSRFRRIALQKEGESE